MAKLYFQDQMCTITGNKNHAWEISGQVLLLTVILKGSVGKANFSVCFFLKKEQELCPSISATKKQQMIFVGSNFCVQTASTQMHDTSVVLWYSLHSKSSAVANIGMQVPCQCKLEDIAL